MQELLTGNAKIKQALFSGISSSMIIDGEAGSGKKTAARFIAAVFMCKKGADKPCLTCPSCRQVLAGTHPDFELLAPEGQTYKVDELRGVRTRSFIKPAQAELKVFVIDRADQMDFRCQDVLLKVLEEPQSSLFILLCENRYALLQTVRSRCICFSMERLDDVEMIGQLAKRYPDQSKGKLNQAVKQAGGVLGRAIAYMEQGDVDGGASRYVKSLTRSELELFESCLELSKLSKEGYLAFCQSAKEELSRQAALQNDARYLQLFDYIAEQEAGLSRNLSVLALSSALSAYSAEMMGY